MKTYITICCCPRCREEQLNNLIREIEEYGWKDYVTLNTNDTIIVNENKYIIVTEEQVTRKVKGQSIYNYTICDHIKHYNPLSKNILECIMPSIILNRAKNS